MLPASPRKSLSSCGATKRIFTKLGLCLTSALLGHRFAAMKVETDSLAHVDPFKLLARGLPSGKFSMGSQTLAVIGATFSGGRIGFYLLANESDASPRKIVSAEALLDDKVRQLTRPDARRCGSTPWALSAYPWNRG
jgi:CDP-diacylglycerol pyrophosphatase